MELHPLCTLFPRLTGYEFDCLKLDIQENGQREPIIVHDGMILDGGNRYAACIELGIEPQTMQFGGGNLASYVLSANLHRRHLSPGQQAAIVACVQDWAKANSHGGDRKSDQSATLHFDSAKNRAATSGASLRTQKTADKVAKAAPELAAQVARGEITLPKAVEQVSPKPKQAEPEPEIDEQEILVDGLNELVEQLYQEIDDLKNKLASGENADSKTRMDELSAEVRKLTALNKSLTKTRDTLMNELAACKKQCEALSRKLKKLEK